MWGQPMRANPWDIPEKARAIVGETLRRLAAELRSRAEADSEWSTREDYDRMTARRLARYDAAEEIESYGREVESWSACASPRAMRAEASRPGVANATEGRNDD